MFLGSMLSVQPAFYDTFYFTISVVQETVQKWKQCVLSSQDRRVTYNAFEFMMVKIFSSLRKEPTQWTTFWRLEICLKSRGGHSQVTEALNKENCIALANDKCSLTFIRFHLIYVLNIWNKDKILVKLLFFPTNIRSHAMHLPITRDDWLIFSAYP